eukprot:gene2274-1416_t
MTFSSPNPSIWVGSLDPTINERKLYDFFVRVGSIVSVRVCVDSATHKSLGYGYVNFQDPADAEKALDLAGTKLGTRFIQISRIQRDPSKRRPGVRNIVVKKLPLTMDTLALKDLFSKFGRLTCVNLACNEKEESRGYARIGFESEESAVEAVKEMDGMEIDGQAIVVERYQPQHREEQYTNLYVKNLDPAVTEEALKEVFSPFGTITSVKVRDLGEVQTEVGFAYVAFSDHASAAKAVEALNDTESKIAKEGMKLDVGRFRSREERERERERTRRERAVQNSRYPNLYVKGFDDTVTSERLKSLFEQYGETVSAKVMMDPSGVSRCFGFVSMKDQGAASQAIQELNGSTFLSPRPLFVTYAVRKDARRQNLEERTRRDNRVRQQPMGGMPPMGFMAPNMFGAMNPMPFPLNRMPPTMPFPGVGPLRHMAGPNPMNQMRAPRPMPMPAAKAPILPMMAQHPMPVQSLAAILANAPPEQHRNILGERLYNYIARSNPAIAPKITGMLLEMDNSEIVNMLENPIMLDSKIAEAKDVLQQHMS